MPSDRRSVPAGTRILEVIVCFGDDPLAAHTVAPGEALSIGPTKDCDLIVRDELVATPMQLVSVDGAGARLFVPHGTTAELVDDAGALVEIVGENNTLIIDNRSAARLCLDNITIDVRWTAAAERVGARNGFDWRAQRGTALSFGFHLLVLLLVAAIPPAGYALTGDTHARAVKFVPFLTKAKQQDDVMPPWLREKNKDKAGRRGGQNAKAAKNEAGKAGSKTAPKRNRRLAVKGTGDHTQPVGAADAVKNAGILGMLRSARGDLAAILDNSRTAIGADGQRAMGNLIGNSIGDAYGVDGIGIDGTGRGGGCVGYDCGTVGNNRGLATIGLGGGKGPKLSWGTGDGKGPGRHRPKAPTVSDGYATLKGSLSRSIIRRTVRRHLNEVKYCYQREVQSNRTLTGRIVVRFIITGKGTVGMAHVKQSSLKNNNVERCVTKAVRRWQFPAPNGGGLVDVSYPFRFHTAGARR